MERILQIVTYMGRGGLETMLMNYYRKMDRTQLQFDFLVHRQEKADYDDEIETLGGKIFRLPRLNPWSVTYQKALTSFFDKHREYKVVHCHLDCMSAIPLRAARLAGVPVRIAHSHNSNQDKNLKYLFKLYFKSGITKEATELFACSEAAGKWMFRTDKFTILPNAIDALSYSYDEQKRDIIRKKLGITDELVIGHVGRFAPPKNHDFLMDIFQEIHKQIPKSKLLLVGGGEGVCHIREKAELLQLEENVVFMGVCDNVFELMQAMDVFVFPSLYEGLPVTIVEAQASGLPCLISDKVPIECKITELVQQIPLVEGANVWAERAILSAENTKRTDMYEDIRNGGFDIKENAERLQQYYLRAATGEMNSRLY